jgi:hypothetical protein
MPSSSASRSSSRPIANDFSCPKMSVNQKRTNSTPSSSILARMSLGLRSVLLVVIVAISRGTSS